MKNLIIIFAVAIMALLLPEDLKAQNKINAQVILETSNPHPGQTIRLALKMEPQQGWHGYWENPGESGLPVSVNWTMPKGLTISGFQHPYPIKLQTGNITNYVHKGPYILLAYLSVPPNFQTNQDIEIKGDFKWAACSYSMCTFEKIMLIFRININKNPNTPLKAAFFNQIEEQMPQKLKRAGKLIKVNGGIEIHVPIQKINPQDASIFMLNNEFVSPSAIPVMVKKGDSIVFSISGTYKKLPESIMGVFSNADNQKSYTFVAKKTDTHIIKNNSKLEKVSKNINAKKITKTVIAKSAPQLIVDPITKKK